MPYSVCWYHIIWSTHERQPVISAPLERVIFSAIKAKAHELKSEVRAVNGVTDHIHVAAKIPPSLSVSEWMRQVKGASSFAVNNVINGTEARFRWQESYGVLTSGEKYLQMVVDYITHQKEHHANKTTLNAYLERDTE